MSDWVRRCLDEPSCDQSCIMPRWLPLPVDKQRYLLLSLLFLKACITYGINPSISSLSFFVSLFLFLFLFLSCAPISQPRNPAFSLALTLSYAPISQPRNPAFSLALTPDKPGHHPFFSFPNPNPNPNPKALPLKPLHLHPLKSSIPPLSPIIAFTASPSTPTQTRVDILSESLLFIQRFRGKTIVVKYGAAAMKSAALQRNVLSNLVLLSCVGLRLVLVHGGGLEINAWLLRTSHEPKFHNGLRVTDAHTMEVVEMVLAGKINKSLVAEINMLGGTGVWLCGKDARLLTARPSSESAVLGFVEGKP